MSEPVRIRVPAMLDADTLHALSDEVEAAASSARAPIVMHGDSDTFCRGLNLLALDDPATRTAAADRFVDLLLTIRRSDRIFAAVVEGAALGGGVGIAASCDVVVASRSATFALPEALFGLAPLTIWPVLRERMTSHAIRRMTISGAGHSGEEAEALGLVDQAVAPDEVEETLALWLRGFRRTRAEGIGALKRHAAEEDDLEGSLRRGTGRLEELLARSDALALARAWEQGIAPWSEP